MRTCKTVLGIDPSLTSTGYAYRAGESITVGSIVPKKRTGVERLLYLKDEITKIVDEAEPDLIAYEGYAMGARGSRSFSLGELGGVLKTSLHLLGYELLIVPPSSMKMFVTGRGNADKIAVVSALTKKSGISFKTTDEADALGLLLVGEAWANPRSRNRNSKHHTNRALKGCSYG